MTELVVARYREDLSWLRNIARGIEVTVYDKSGEPAEGSIELPNIGREAHTYLHHIVNRYDSLAPVTVFCQGKPFDHAFDFHATLRELTADPGGFSGFHWLGHIIDTDDDRGRTLFASWSKNSDGHELDLRGFHTALFGDAGPSEYTFCLGGQFIIAADSIRSRSLEFYRRALAVSTSFHDAAHCFERSWDKVFGTPGFDAAWLAGRKTVYLKPIRRLKQTS